MPQSGLVVGWVSCVLRWRGDIHLQGRRRSRPRKDRGPPIRIQWAYFQDLRYRVKRPLVLTPRGYAMFYTLEKTE